MSGVGLLVVEFQRVTDGSIPRKSDTEYCQQVGDSGY